MNNEISILKKEIDEIKKILKTLTNIIFKKKENIYNNLNIKKLQVPSKYILQCLQRQDTQGDYNLFRKNFELQNIGIPIIVINNQTYKYYKNGEWLIDRNGYNICNIILYHVINAYTKINNLDNINDMNVFLTNQLYITKLRQHKYKSTITTYRKQLLNIIKNDLW